MKDYYLILGVQHDVPIEAIRAAYRKLAKQHHPDRAGPGGAAGFRDISEAYRTLSDPGLRRSYDSERRRRRERLSSTRAAGSATASHWDLVLTPWEAVLGCEFVLNVTPGEGEIARKVRVRVPPGAVSGSVLEIYVSESVRIVLHLDCGG
jgi:DnaJ-class molecular chaperone